MNREWPLPPTMVEVMAGGSGVHAFSGDYDEFVELAIGTARATWLKWSGPGTDPDPLLIFGSGTKAMLLRIPHHHMQSAGAKAFFVTDVVGKLARMLEPAMIAFTGSAWVAVPHSPAQIEVDRLHAAGEKIPWLPELGLEGVEERAHVQVYRREHSELWQARVTRLADGDPIVGKFRLDQGELVGLFPEAFLAALR